MTVNKIKFRSIRNCTCSLLEWHSLSIVCQISDVFFNQSEKLINVSCKTLSPDHMVRRTDGLSSCNPCVALFLKDTAFFTLVSKADRLMRDT
jgi:hypothetical protein